MSSSRFTISDINIITSKRHKLPFDSVCSICRHNLNEDSPSYQAKGMTSYIIIGECGHAFHKECFEPWYQKNPICPMCTTKWKYRQQN